MSRTRVARQDSVPCPNCGEPIIVVTDLRLLLLRDIADYAKEAWDP